MKGHDVENVTRFAGLTSHNNAEMTDRAANIAGIDAESPPETSLATAIRDLETADESQNAWKVPDSVGRLIDTEELRETTPEGVEIKETVDGELFVTTDRFQSIVSPDKLRAWAKGDFRDDDTNEFHDPLWHNPTRNYSIVNPLTAYEPLEEAIREEELGDHVFGEIREYKSGGEVHMDILFDAFEIDYNESDDDNDRDPIVLGIRTGYDFFGGTALYFEGFAQDTRCSNSIRSITDEKVVRHVGDTDLEDVAADLLSELGLMTDRLAELIEMAEGIELDLGELSFSEPFDHNDDLQGFYELVGFPTYLARHAASHARHRADDQFQPDMTAVWDGATYALTHEFNGGENTSTAREYIETANDMVMNPSRVIGQAQRQHRNRLAAQSEDNSEQVDLEGESAHAKIEEFSQSVQEKKAEFETTQEQLRNTLLDDADDGGDGEAEATA